MEDEARALMCVTNLFVQDRVRAYTGNNDIQSAATNINWAYSRGASTTPIQVNFTSDTRYTSTDDAVPRMDVYYSFDLTSDDITDYIQNYVWTLSDQNLFYYAFRLSYMVRLNHAAPPGRIERVDNCDVSPPPIIIAPEITFSPGGWTTSPPQSTTNAPGSTSSPTSPGNVFQPGTDPTGLPAASQAPASTPSPNNPNPTSPPDQPSNPDATSSPNTPGGQTPAPATAPPQTGAPVQPDGLAHFRLDFGFEEGYVREPTLPEMEEILCQINTYFRDLVRSETGDRRAEIDARNIDWTTNINSTTFPVVSIYFTCFAVHGPIYGEGDPVRRATVLSALPRKYQHMIDHFKRVPTEGNIFAHITDFGLNADAPVGVAEPRLESSPCPITPAPTQIFFDLTAPPYAGPGPAFTDNTNSNKPSGPNATSGDGDTFADGDGDGDIYPENMGDPLYQGASAAGNIYVNFLVSNLHGIEDAMKVNASGLGDSFPLFIDEVARRLARKHPQKSAVTREGGRYLQETTARVYWTGGYVEVKPYSAYIYQLNPSPCGPRVHPDSICHLALARYSILFFGSNTMSQREIKEYFEDRTYDLINDGTYHVVLRRDVPKSPLYIGTVNPPKENRIPQERGVSVRAVFIMIIVLLLIMAVLLAFCVAIYYWFVPEEERRDDIFASFSRTDVFRKAHDDTDTDSDRHKGLVDDTDWETDCTETSENYAKILGVNTTTSTISDEKVVEENSEFVFEEPFVPETSDFDHGATSVEIWEDEPKIAEGKSFEEEEREEVKWEDYGIQPSDKHVEQANLDILEMLELQLPEAAEENNVEWEDYDVQGRDEILSIDYDVESTNRFLPDLLEVDGQGDAQDETEFEGKTQEDKIVLEEWSTEDDIHWEDYETPRNEETPSQDELTLDGVLDELLKVQEEGKSLLERNTFDGSYENDKNEALITQDSDQALDWEDYEPAIGTFVEDNADNDTDGESSLRSLQEELIAAEHAMLGDSNSVEAVEWEDYDQSDNVGMSEVTNSGDNPMPEEVMHAERIPLEDYGNTGGLERHELVDDAEDVQWEDYGNNAMLEEAMFVEQFQWQDNDNNDDAEVESFAQGTPTSEALEWNDFAEEVVKENAESQDLIQDLLEQGQSDEPEDVEWEDM